MDLGIDGRSAFVARADEGAGKACARALAAEGARLAEAPNGCDIVVVHRQGQRPRSVLDPAGLDHLRSAWDSLLGAVTTYRTALPGMEERHWGRLIWIGSAQAKSIDGADDELDAITSLGMMGLHKVVTAEEAPHNVTANTVLRGGDATDEDVANTVAFLCSEGAGYLSGTTIVVDGGAGSAVF